MIFVILIASSIILLFLTTITKTKTKEKIYFISKSTEENREFWAPLEEGALLAASSRDKELVIVGSEKEVQINKQIEVVNEVIDSKPFAIIIAAADYEALSEVCNKALEQGIALVAVDSDVRTTIEHSLVATDNEKAANQLALDTIENVNGEGSYAIISHVKGVKTTTDRALGFKEVMDEKSSLKFVGEYYSNNSLENAVEKTKEVIENNEDIKVIFGTNETTVEGVGKAIDELGLSHKIYIVGFDTNDNILYYLETGSIDKVMLQTPFNMGYLAVEEALAYKKTKKTNRVDTQAILIDKASMFKPENAKTIFPIEIE